MCPETICKEENMKYHQSEWYLSKLQLDESACREAAEEFLTHVFNNSESENEDSDDECKREEKDSVDTRSDSQQYSLDDPYSRRESMKPWYKFY